MFDPPSKLLLGLFTGVLFGFLLQKGHVAKHTLIVKQLLLRDWTMAKIMAVAITVGGLGVWALAGLGLTELSVKPMQLGGVLLGAVCFGVGLAVLGYCPGTAVAAAGEGRKDAVAGIAGMVAGAAAFVIAFPLVDRVRAALVDYGKLTWPRLTATSPWPWLFGFGLVIATLYVIDRLRHPLHHPRGQP
jgi:uncharacterized protein